MTVPGIHVGAIAIGTWCSSLAGRRPPPPKKFKLSLFKLIFLNLLHCTLCKKMAWSQAWSYGCWLGVIGLWMGFQRPWVGRFWIRAFSVFGVSPLVFAVNVLARSAEVAPSHGPQGRPCPIPLLHSQHPFSNKYHPVNCFSNAGGVGGRGGSL